MRKYKGREIRMSLRPSLAILPPSSQEISVAKPFYMQLSSLVRP